MFGQFLFANDHWQRLRAACARWIRSYRNWVSERAAVREARGLKLLRGWLSPRQRAQYDARGYFEVVGCQTGRLYRIHHGIAVNVHELNSAGQVQTGWCFVPDSKLVAGDVMLAQKIALETDERDALAVAREFKPEQRRSNIG
jgi:hypothetical protein